MRRIRGERWSLICVAVAAAACSRTNAVRPGEVAGSWARPGDAFPPVNLTLTDSAGVLHARLRLSGTDAKGTATLDGRQIQLILERRGVISGEFVSATELRLGLEGERSYTLYRSASKER